MSGMFRNLADRVSRLCPLGIEGRVRNVVGLSIVAEHLPVAVGSLCQAAARPIR